MSSTALPPGTYAIYTGTPTIKTAPFSRTNFGINCPSYPAAVNTPLTLASLGLAATARDTGKWIYTGDGMLLSKQSVGVECYADVQPGAANVSSATGVMPVTATKSIIRISESGSNTSDPGNNDCYVGTIMTSGVNSQYWHVDTAQLQTANTPISLEDKATANPTTWIFVSVD